MVTAWAPVHLDGRFSFVEVAGTWGRMDPIDGFVALPT